MIDPCYPSMSDRESDNKHDTVASKGEASSRDSDNRDDDEDNFAVAMAPPAKRAKKSAGGAVPRKTRKVIESDDDEDNAINDDNALLAKMGKLLKGNDPLAFDWRAAPAEQAVRTNFSRTKINGLMHSNNPLAPLAGNAPPFNINIKCNCRDGMTKKATETIVPKLVH
jgi:hypothetical protein